jgi:hypothetical protein
MRAGDTGSGFNLEKAVEATVCMHHMNKQGLGCGSPHTFAMLKSDVLEKSAGKSSWIVIPGASPNTNAEVRAAPKGAGNWPLVTGNSPVSAAGLRVGLPVR